MSKIQPPRGYIKAIDVKARLNISDAMIRYYVQKDKIKYLVPPGRKQGFYLEKDVDKLANELTAFIHMDEIEDTQFVLASEEDMIETIKIGYAIFHPDRTPPTKTSEWHRNALVKNPEMNYVLKKDDQLLGYASIFPFKASSEKIYKCFEVDTLKEVNITNDDIETFDSGNHVNLYIMAIAMNPSLSKNEQRTYGSRLISRIITFVVSLGERGVVIENIVSRGDTKSGVKLLKAFGFTEVERRRSDSRPFIMNIETSGAPIAMQYKQALCARE